MNSGLILFRNSASRLLCGEKPTTILPPAHDHVLIQSVHAEEGLFTDGSVVNVFVREREQERGKEGLSESMCCAQLYNEIRFYPF